MNSYWTVLCDRIRRGGGSPQFQIAFTIASALSVVSCQELAITFIFTYPFPIFFLVTSSIMQAILDLICSWPDVFFLFEIIPHWTQRKKCQNLLIFRSYLACPLQGPNNNIMAISVAEDGEANNIHVNHANNNNKDIKSGVDLGTLDSLTGFVVGEGSGGEVPHTPP